MRAILLAAAAALAVLAITVSPAVSPAAAAASNGASVTVSAKAKTVKKAKKHQARSLRRAGAPRYVACTVLGCHPTPPGCHPEVGYDFFGNPTGFDAIVCR
jgi:hypothetical protein